MTVGEKIRELRKEIKLSQEELAEEIGASRTMVSLWEREEFEPSLLSAICLADFFNVSLDELCCRDFKGGF